MCVSHQEFRNGFNGSNRSQCIDPVHHKKQVQECFWRGPHHLLFHNVHWMSKALAKRTRKTRTCVRTCEGWPNGGFASRLASSRKSQKVVHFTQDDLRSICLDLPTNLSSTKVNTSGWPNKTQVERKSKTCVNFSANPSYSWDVFLRCMEFHKLLQKLTENFSNNPPTVVKWHISEDIFLSPRYWWSERLTCSFHP